MYGNSWKASEITCQESNWCASVDNVTRAPCCKLLRSHISIIKFKPQVKESLGTHQATSAYFLRRRRPIVPTRIKHTFYRRNITALGRRHRIRYFHIHSQMALWYAKYTWIRAPIVCRWAMLAKNTNAVLIGIEGITKVIVQITTRSRIRVQTRSVIIGSRDIHILKFFALDPAVDGRYTWFTCLHPCHSSYRSAWYRYSSART